jgi:serine/threonine protein kinase
MSGQLLENATIKQYQIERHLAVGGMSNVYLARDLRTGAAVAIKVVPQDISDYSERFLREAKATSTLRHEHILPALDYGEYGPWYYLVTPYIAGGSLQTYLAQERVLNVQQAGLILGQLTSAIQYAHERGTMHRDIKAANVLLRDPEYVYLTDFGLVKSNDDAYSLTRTGYLVGTPEYMAPELMEGNAVPASDIYALGVLLFIMLTGRPPFSGPTPLAVMFKHLNEPAPALSTYNPAVPRAIEQVVLRALAKDPGARYPSAHALMQAYQQALDEPESTISQATTVVLAPAPQMLPSEKVAPASPVEEKPVKETPGLKPPHQIARSINKHPRLVGIACIIGICLFSALMFAFNGGLFKVNPVHHAAAKQVTPGVTTTVRSMSTPTLRSTSTDNATSGSQQRTGNPTSIATKSTVATPGATSVVVTPTPTATLTPTPTSPSILSPVLTPISILTGSSGHNGHGKGSGK